MSSTIWKSRPTLVGEAPPPLPLGLRHVGHRERAPDAGGEELPCLQAVERHELVAVEGPVRRDVDVLPADHPECRRGKLPRRPRRRVREDQPERLREERIAGKDRDSLPEAHVRARLAAPQIVVVEGREVVVHEAERVHELERAGRWKELVR